MIACEDLTVKTVEGDYISLLRTHDTERAKREKSAKLQKCTKTNWNDQFAEKRKNLQNRKKPIGLPVFRAVLQYCGFAEIFGFFCKTAKLQNCKTAQTNWKQPEVLSAQHIIIS
jgi:hypothetical protein